MVIGGVLKIEWLGFRSHRTKKQCRAMYESQGKIPAIKLYRELTGADLKSAKETIEKWSGEFPLWHRP